MKIYCQVYLQIGIPKSLEGSVIPFPFNNIKKVKSIIDNNELAAIKMEVERDFSLPR